MLIKPIAIFILIIVTILKADTVCVQGNICGKGNIVNISNSEISFVKDGNESSATILSNNVIYFTIDGVKYSFLNNLPGAILVSDTIITSLSSYLMERENKKKVNNIAVPVFNCDPEYSIGELNSKKRQFALLRNGCIFALCAGVASAAGALQLLNYDYSEPYTFEETENMEIRDYYFYPVIAFSLVNIGIGSTFGIISIIKIVEYKRRIAHCKSID